MSRNYPQLDKEVLIASVREKLVEIRGKVESSELTVEELKASLNRAAETLYEAKEIELGEQMREIERVLLLKVIDQKWTDHLDNMDQMKQGINLQAYGQRDPLVEYRFLSYDIFEEMTDNIKNIIMLALVGVLAVAVLILSVGLAYERGHNSGYNEGWNDGRADGIGTGWTECIEENNVYERY